MTSFKWPIVTSTQPNYAEKQINKGNKSQAYTTLILVKSLSTSPLLISIVSPRSISPDCKSRVKILFLEKYFCCDWLKINMEFVVPYPCMKPSYSWWPIVVSTSLTLSTIFRISGHFHFLKHMSLSLTKALLQSDLIKCIRLLSCRFLSLLVILSFLALVLVVLQHFHSTSGVSSPFLYDVILTSLMYRIKVILIL